ncbi:putative phage phi-c31 gp36-like protein [Ralstonia solanacearum CMR15]|nr:putative phage phi-c31 gp36-like protein [Ralstonia solanacearum CMR15]
MTLAELKQKRAKIAAEMRSLNDNIGEAAWNDEQRSRWDTMRADLKKLDEQIEREEELRSAEQRYVETNADDLAKQARQAAADATGGATDDERRSAAFGRFLREGLGELSAEERRALQELRAQGASAPDKGGYTVPRTFLAKVVEQLVTYGGIASVMQNLTTDGGEPIEWPVALGVDEEGELLGEGDPASEDDIDFGTGSLGAHKLSSKVIRVSNELLSDSSIDIEAFLAGRIASRIGRAESRLLVQGTGGGKPPQPRGLAASVAITKSTAAAAKLTWQEVNTLIHAVDPAYRNAPMYRLAFNDQTLQTLEELVDANGRPLWLPGLDASAPATILKRQYVIDQAIDDIGAGKKFMYGGDFNQFILRRVRYMAVKRLVERYAEYDQVGFLAFHRFGCVLQDTSAIAALVGKPAA